MCENYEQFIPDLVAMMDNLVRAISKTLFGDNARNNYNVYLRRQCQESGITHAVLEALAAASRISMEKRTEQAILYTSFNKIQGAEITIHVKALVAKFNKKQLKLKSV